MTNIELDTLYAVKYAAKELPGLLEKLVERLAKIEEKLDNMNKRSGEDRTTPHND